LKPGNAGGGKDPDFWRAFEEGEVKVIGKSLQTPTRIRSLQRKLYRKAKAEPAYRFYMLYDKVCREDILRHAYALARSNAGAPGVDAVTFADIDLSGREAWLVVLRQKTRRLFLLNLLTQYGHLGSILAIATIKR